MLVCWLCASMCVFIVHALTCPIVLVAPCMKEHCHCGNIIFSFSIILFSLRLTKCYCTDLFFLNNTWVKKKIGRICGELQNRSEGLTCSNPVGAWWCGPRTSRGLWPGLDVAVNGGRFVVFSAPPAFFSHCLSSGPSADLFAVFREIVKYLAIWLVPL